jgi:hypothetical protein
MTSSSSPRDPLLARLRRLPRIAPDDVAAARTLARAEAELRPVPAAARARGARWLMPMALAAWGALYAWGAIGEIGRLYPDAGGPRRLAAAGPGPASVHVQGHEQHQRKHDGDDDDHATLAPRLRHVAVLVRRFVGHGSLLRKELSARAHTWRARARESGLIESDYADAAAGGPRQDRGADGGATGACAGVRAAASVDTTTRIHTTNGTGTCGGSRPQPGIGDEGSRPTRRGTV